MSNTEEEIRKQLHINKKNVILVLDEVSESKAKSINHFLEVAKHLSDKTLEDVVSNLDKTLGHG